MKYKFVAVLLWFFSGLIAFAFLILPDLISSIAISHNWFFRLFFALFLCNPLMGAARALNNPGYLDEFLHKYRNTDKDSLVISQYIFSVVFVLVLVLACFLAFNSFYPSLGYLIYLITIIYGILVGILQYTFLEMKLRRLRQVGANNG
ncbi:MAG TPA: hypothetical protein VMT73_05005 [Anaerolineales bacterium]|nr:hypothetical protein [Anaerolineales bacterium]